MAKIKPVISKKHKRNIYEYFDPELNTNIKVSGFDIDVYDNLTQRRIRKRIIADYKTVNLYVQNLQKDIHNVSLNLFDNEQLPHLTLNDLMEEFKADKSQKSDRVGKGLDKESIRRYKSSVNSLLKYSHQKILLTSITETFIESWIKYRRKNKISIYTINSDLRHLKIIFKWGIRNNLINVNPFNNVALFKCQPKEIRVLTESEINMLWKVCKPNSRWYPYIAIYLLTGVRISEVLKPKLRWDDINFNQNTITFRKRKRGKLSTIYLTKTLKAVFLSLKVKGLTKMKSIKKDDDQFVFPFSPSYVSRMLKSEVFIPAGLPEVTVHDLRRSFASHLANLGFELYDVSKLLAHSKIDVTQTHYLSQLPSKSRKMLEDLEKHLGFKSEKVLS